jgi:hypothetical protein
MAIIRVKTGLRGEYMPSGNFNSPGGKLFFHFVTRSPHGVFVGNEENPPREFFRFKQTGYFLINIRPRNERFCPAAKLKARCNPAPRSDRTEVPLCYIRRLKLFSHKSMYTVSKQLTI